MDKIINQPQENKPRQTMQDIHQCNEKAYLSHYIDPHQGLAAAGQAYELSVSEIFQGEPYLQGQADSLLNLSHFNYLFGNMNLALKQAEESMLLYQKLEQLLPQAELYAHLGQIFDIYNNRNNSIEYLVRGLDIAKSNHFELTEGKILLYIGKAYMQMGNFRQSIHSTLQANEIFHKYRLNSFTSIGLINLAEAYDRLAQSEKAYHAIYQALDIAVEGDFQVILSEGFYRLGMMHLENNEFDIARSHLSYSQRIAKKNNLKYTYLRANLGLGEILIFRYETQPALGLLKKCLQDAEQIRIDDLILEAHQKLADLYEALHQYKLSLDHFRAFSELTNKNINKQSLQKMQTVEVLYRTRSAKREAELTRHKNATLENEILERKKIEEELRKSEKRYRAMASYDPLTKLFNRRHFFNLAEIEFERAKRYDHSLSVLLIDLDHFKLINDRYGHLIGDEMLEFVAKICKGNLRKIDIIGRYGGEEFIVLLPQTSSEQALKLAGRICSTIQNSTMPCSKGPVTITASIGVSVNSLSYERLETLFDMADKALYAAKKNGRNQVCLASDLQD